MSYSNHIVCLSVCPSICLSIRLSTLSLCWDNSNTFQPRTFKLCIWVIYQIGGEHLQFLGSLCKRSRSQATSLGFFTFLSLMLHCAAITGIPSLQRTFKLGQNVCLGKILVKFENWAIWGLSVCPSICLSTLSLCCINWNTCTFLQKTFKLCQNVSLDKISVNFEYRSSGVCPFVCLSIRLSTLSLCCDNWNTSLQRTFKLCIWVIYQIRGTPIIFGVIMSKVKVTDNFWVFFLAHLST